MVVPSYQNCVYTSHFSAWQVDHTWIYSFSLVFQNLMFFMYYGRQLRQLTNVQNFTPRKGKLNVLVDLHPLAQTMPCMNVLLFWMDTICKQQPLPRKKYITRKGGVGG